MKMTIMNLNIFVFCATVFFLIGCAAGPVAIAMERTKTTTYGPDGKIVSVKDEQKVNEPIAKAGLATAAVGISKSPIAAAIVAGAQSIGDGIGNAVKRSGDTVNDIIGGNSGGTITPLSVGQPKPIPAVDDTVQNSTQVIKKNKSTGATK